MEKETDPVIRQMSGADLTLCGHLVQQAGWNQLESDWIRAMTLEPAGCFVAEAGSKGIATTTCCRFGSTGWIAMVLVDQNFRGLGIAGKLMQHAIAFLEQHHVFTICLDATTMGEKVYRKLGFEGTYEVVRYSREPEKITHTVRDTIKREDGLTPAITALDKLASGVDRSDFLASFSRPGEKVYYRESDTSGTTNGFACYRPGRHAVQIGPAVATDKNAGLRLLSCVLSDLSSIRSFIDIPAPNNEAIHWAESNGFTRQRSFIRMFRGVKPNDPPDLIWASSGPEKG